MQGLLHRLVDRFGWKLEKRANARRRRWTEMGDVINLVLVKADPFDEIDLDFVAGRKAADQRRAIQPAMLCNREDRRNVVAGVRIIRGKKGVVKIEFTHGDAIRPCRPLR